MLYGPAFKDVAHELFGDGIIVAHRHVGGY